MTREGIEETRDAELLASFFSGDPARYIYQLGDLDPLFFPASRWWIARRDQVTASLLLYSAFETAVVQGITDNDDQGSLWEALLPELPQRAHVHYLRRHEPILRARYKIRRCGAHQRMKWNRQKASLEVGDTVDVQVRPLRDDDRRPIRALYQAAYPGAHFDERTLGMERTVGALAGTQLVAIAACHVLSRQFSVAAIGAVATHPGHRGRGYCTAVTASLLRLLAGDVQTIGLNVSCENTTAIHIYERLGFEHHCFYEEAMLEAK
jgi:ribosomal protein S18 acetylase RimI-like enzyme